MHGVEVHLQVGGLLRLLVGHAVGDGVGEDVDFFLFDVDHRVEEGRRVLVHVEVRDVAHLELADVQGLGVAVQVVAAAAVAVGVHAHVDAAVLALAVVYHAAGHLDVVEGVYAHEAAGAVRRRLAHQVVHAVHAV